MAAPVSAVSGGTVGLSIGGKLFFGGLTAGTFGLGCWQVQRYFEKIDQIAERTSELAMDATTDWKSKAAPYRRKLLEGKFLHQKEVLIGPRGAPAGHSGQESSASSKGVAGGGGGMGPSPQGYLVLTPLKLLDGNMVWINRGWVPKAMVPGADRGGRPSKVPVGQLNNWNRPTGTLQLTAIQSKSEKPKMIAIDHDYSKRPLQLFWMDGIALQAIAESDEETVLLTQIDESIEVEDKSGKQRTRPLYPALPSLNTLADFKTTPAIHAGYAATWYGLSIAGVYMTRKLITRGRG